MIQKVVLPSFREDKYSPYDMRQLVSALEIRFQSIESDKESIYNRNAYNDELYSPIGHTHSQSEVLGLDVPDSIFDLSDVSGTYADGQAMVWDGDSFAPGSINSANLSLNDLLNVSVPSPTNNQVLQYNSGTARWEALDSTSSLAGLSDVNISSAEQYDVLFKATGSLWQHAAGLLQWNPDNQYLQLANDFSINWRDTSYVTIELLSYTDTGSGTPSFSVGDSSADTVIDGADTTIDSTLTVTGAATFDSTVAATGNVTGANLNVANWDTAYGWGDHSAAGYRTSNVVTKTTNYTLTSSDDIVLVNGTYTMTLPTAVGINEKVYTIKNIGTGTVTVDGDGAETIDDQTTVNLSPYEALKIVSDNTEWWII